MIYSKKKKSVFLLDGNCARRQKKKKKKTVSSETGCASVNPPPFFRNRISATRVHTRVFTYLRIHAVLSLSIHLFNYTIVVRSGAGRDVGYGREIERESGKGRKHDPMKP